MHPNFSIVAAKAPEVISSLNNASTAQDLAKNKVEKICEGKSLVLVERIKQEQEALVRIGYLIGPQNLKVVFDLLARVVDYDATSSNTFAETITDLFELILQNYSRREAIVLAQELANLISTILADAPAIAAAQLYKSGDRAEIRERIEVLAQEIWVKKGKPVNSKDADWAEAERAISGESKLICGLFILAQSLANKIPVEGEPVPLRAALDLLNNASQCLKESRITMQELGVIIRLRKLIDYLPEQKECKVKLGMIMQDLCHNQNVAQRLVELKTLEKELTAQAKALEIKFAEVDQLGYEDVDDNWVVQQLYVLNKLIKTTVWGGKTELSALRTKKRKGAKIYVAYVEVNGGKYILAQTLIIGNYLRLLGVLDAFHGVGIGMRMSEFRLLRVMQAGHTCAYFNTLSDSQRRLELDENFLRQLSDLVKQQRTQTLSEFGIVDNTEPSGEVRELVGIIKEDPAATVIQRYFHFYGADAKRQLVEKILGFDSEEGLVILDTLGITGLLQIRDQFLVGVDISMVRRVVGPLAIVVKALEERRAAIYYPEIYTDICSVLNTAKALNVELFSELVDNLAKLVARPRYKKYEDDVFFFVLRGFLMGVRSGLGGLTASAASGTRRDGIIITISGGAGAGKTVTGTSIAAKVNSFIFSIGFLYRAIAWIAQENKLDLANQKHLLRILGLAKDLHLVNERHEDGRLQLRIYYLDRDISFIARDPLISRLVPVVNSAMSKAKIPSSLIFMPAIRGLLTTGVNAIIDGRTGALTKIKVPKIENPQNIPVIKFCICIISFSFCID